MTPDNLRGWQTRLRRPQTEAIQIKGEPFRKGDRVILACGEHLENVSEDRVSTVNLDGSFTLQNGKGKFDAVGLKIDKNSSEFVEYWTNDRFEMLSLNAWQHRLGLTAAEAARQTRTPLETYRSYIYGKRRIPDNFALLCWYRERFGPVDFEQEDGP